MISPETHLSREDAAAYLHHRIGWGTRDTLARLAREGRGPLMVLSGRRVFYPKTELDTWAAAQISPPTATGRRNKKRVAAEK